MFVEVEQSANCESSVFLRFKELGSARPVSHVKIYDRVSVGEWCRVVGWRDDDANPVCQAFAQPIEDSGAGYGLLVFGGFLGLRLMPAELDEDWSIESPRQWGEPYLIISEERDLRFA